MRAILISVAILVMSGPMLAQQRRPPGIVQRTFVPDEPLPCVAFNRMAARLDAIYKTEEISKDKYQRISLQPGNLAEFIRWYVVEGGRGQMSTADSQCSTELEEREDRFWGVFTLRRLQDA